MNLFSRSLTFVYRRFGLNFNEQIKKEQVRQFNVLSKEASNEYFKKIIDSDKPALLSRLGTPESDGLLNYLQVISVRNNNILKKYHAIFKGNKPYWDSHVKMNLYNLVGFFPTTNEKLLEFAALYANKIKNIDGIGVWGFVPGENFIIRRYCLNSVKYNPVVLDPYFFDSPWTYGLKNKRVLVIHPFVDSIKNQFVKRELLFNNKKILPEFELLTIKAVQSIAGNKTPFANWFEALEFMKSQIATLDFDIALIGAGSYGLPLASHIKDLGKCAIHMGGSLQILFGIKGKRWDEHPPTAALYNEYWVRPDKNELVPNTNIVEGGCYW